MQTQPTIVVSCGASRTQHLVIVKRKGRFGSRTLCGRLWEHRSAGRFQPKIDCQHCRHQQEERA
jgi:hypothetical protein